MDTNCASKIDNDFLGILWSDNNDLPNPSITNKYDLDNNKDILNGSPNDDIFKLHQEDQTTENLNNYFTKCELPVLTPSGGTINSGTIISIQTNEKFLTLYNGVDNKPISNDCLQL